MPAFAFSCSASDAAVILLQQLVAEKDNLKLLSSLHRSPPLGLPAPFDEPAAYDRLIDTLIASGGLRVQLRQLPYHAQSGSAVYIEADLRALRQLLYGNMSISALLGGVEQQCGEDSVIQGAAAARLRAAVRGGRVRGFVLDAIGLLRAARHLLREQLDDDEPLSAMGVSAEHLQLIHSATAPVRGRPIAQHAVQPLVQRSAAPAVRVPLTVARETELGVRRVRQRLHSESGSDSEHSSSNFLAIMHCRNDAGFHSAEEDYDL